MNIPNIAVKVFELSIIPFTSISCSILFLELNNFFYYNQTNTRFHPRKLHNIGLYIGATIGIIRLYTNKPLFYYLFL